MSGVAPADASCSPPHSVHNARMFVHTVGEHVFSFLQYGNKSNVFITSDSGGFPASSFTAYQSVHVTLKKPSVRFITSDLITPSC